MTRPLAHTRPVQGVGTVESPQGFVVEAENGLKPAGTVGTVLELLVPEPDEGGEV